MEGRVIAITGGAGGIGLATAKLLASRGAKLSLADVSEDALKAARKEIKEAVPTVDDLLTYKCDVREYKQVEDWIKQTVDQFGKLDGAANLAGTVGPRPYTYTIDEEDEDIWNLIIGVNLTGVMHCLKAEGKFMKTGASIVNAASVAGIRGTPNMAAYCASKHGVVGLTRSAAKDYGPKGIRVNAIAPGYVETPMTAHMAEVVGSIVKDMSAQMAALGRTAKPEEIAALIAFLLSDDASYITGAVYEVDAGLSA